MAFKRYRNYSDEDVITVIVANSQLATIGECVKYRTNGFATAAAAGDAIAGVVIDIVDAQGASVFGSLAILGLATVSGSAGSGSCTVGSTNQTVDQIAVKVDTSKKTVYSASVTGTINTTVASSTQGGWVNLEATLALNVDETTATRTVTTLRTFKFHGSDADDSTRMLVSISSSEVWDPQGALA